MGEILKWAWVVVVFAVLIGGAATLARWVVDDLLRRPAQTRDRRVKRS